ncbi:AlpA family transcriptional regulator [Vibrio parahaemolyticus]|uniref:helix-turn-helix transcriptional regulator n=1 Tax=Vibrio parahaemolyticus TaxID=670 RepID=UPI00084AA307|nr:AlpA family transcriptional regulator [Vibrio parahaemolyticus]EJG0321787.1 AlpA family transcriptional regulator [Vibrio parahaemolyticus]EJG0430179.1 AlpA family transcriptional regulator [Vibrio parahaemolyticus]MCC3785979.1 AlpA family transcriptional regulator [Vibrio parahaemolyticus]MCC3833673.1 AlpA family transcriptional regulator [Vibrio parahaemolyticus]MCC3837798.1 AlpA family transcriptional regulator [Vibrio parahaemolyticus]
MGLNFSNVETHLLRLPQAVSLTGLSRASFYRQVKDGLLPSQIHIGPNSVAWLSHEIETVIAARICGYSDDEIQLMVKDIIQQRSIFKEEK